MIKSLWMDSRAFFLMIISTSRTNIASRYTIGLFFFSYRQHILHEIMILIDFLREISTRRLSTTTRAYKGAWPFLDLFILISG